MKEKVYLVEAKFVNGKISDQEFRKLAEQHGKILPKEDFKEIPIGKYRIRYVVE